MTIDWDQFNDGDEIAVKLVGTWRKGGSWSGLELLGGTFLLPDLRLGSAVDAYRIEPDYKSGDMVRTPSGAIWQCYQTRDWRLIADEYGRPPRLLPSIHDVPSPSTRVKVVDA